MYTIPRDGGSIIYKQISIWGHIYMLAGSHIIIKKIICILITQYLGNILRFFLGYMVFFFHKLVFVVKSPLLNDLNSSFLTIISSPSKPSHIYIYIIYVNEESVIVQLFILKELKSSCIKGEK